MDAFAALVERHKGRVYRTLYQMVGNAEDASDLAQEAFLKAYRALSGYRGDAAFTTWFHRLTVNVALDWLRSRSRRPLQVPLEPPGDPSGRAPPMPTIPTPEEQVMAREQQERVAAALEALRPEQRQVVVLHHFHGLSYHEVARRLGVPVRTVETRLYRARGCLRQMLTGMEGGGGGGLPGCSVPAGSVPGR